MNTNIFKTSLFSLTSSLQKAIFTFLFILFFTFMIGLTSANAQCAMCRASVETNYNNGAGEASARLNAGILYLLSAPYLLIGTVAFLWYRNNQKNKKNGKRTLKITSSHSN